MKTLVLTLVAGLGALPAGAGPAADSEKLVAANTAFAFDLLGKIAETAPDANLFISPYSASTALQLVENGAAGDTRAQMQRTLHTAGMSPAALDAAFQTLNHQFTDRQQVTLDLANGLWFQNGLRLKPSFLDENKQFFAAQVAGVDFNSPQSAHTINAWAGKQTEGRIKEIVQFPFPAQTRLILANAIYFKGKWVRPFKPQETVPRDFHPPGGEIKPTPMMTQGGRFAYQENDQFQAVKLPYQGGLQMELYLPRSKASPRRLLADLAATENGLAERGKAFALREGTVMLPKFEVECRVQLNQPLAALGMRDAFTGRADFSGITDEERLFISEVLQKSFVKVDEQGTEAAAVTTITMQRAALLMPPPDRFTMILDHPFLFMISDTDTGSILFMGILNNPAAGD